MWNQRISQHRWYLPLLGEGGVSPSSQSIPIVCHVQLLLLINPGAKLSGHGHRRPEVATHDKNGSTWRSLAEALPWNGKRGRLRKATRSLP